MKLSKLSQLFLVSSLGLSVAVALTACSSVSIDYLYVADSTGKGGSGQIETFALDSDVGSLRTVAAATAIGDSSPVSLAETSDYYNLYVASQGKSTVTHFTIASTGNLTKADSISLPGMPVAISVSSDNNYLYALTSDNTASKTSTQYVYVNQYKLSSGTIGSLVARATLSVTNHSGDKLIPTGLYAMSTTAVYATFYDYSAYGSTPTTSSANSGWVFAVPVSSGTMGTPIGYQAGVEPSAVTTDPTFRFVYVTDLASDQLIGYSITNDYKLTALLSDPFTTGVQPTAITMDPRGKFIYVANGEGNTVSAYTIDSATGIPTAAVSTSGSSSNATDSNPVAILVDPALGRFVITANYLGNTLSSLHLDATAGTLTPGQGTPFTTGYAPTAIIMAPHGNHATQTVTK